MTTKKATQKTARKQILAPTKEPLEFPCVRAKVLGVSVYRGFAALADLAEISKADIYDHKNNPEGTQRA